MDIDDLSPREIKALKTLAMSMTLEQAKCFASFISALDSDDANRFHEMLRNADDFNHIMRVTKAAGLLGRVIRSALIWLATLVAAGTGLYVIWRDGIK